MILLAGPSGSGKSTIMRAAGLPMVFLDDFYKAGSDSTLPCDPALGIVDWDDPASWDGAAALAAIEQLCAVGCAQVPVYDIAADGPSGSRAVEVGDGPFVAEGIFAPELVAPLQARGLLLDAIVVRRDPWKNLVRRAARDLRERRKPPITILRRGLALYRAEPRVVGRALGAGCRPLDARATRRALAGHALSAARGPTGPSPRSQA
ncbi:MAG TPA: uridine kinase [Candidatus Nanopelagicales bacterium]